jgi:hypothetical protein
MCIGVHVYICPYTCICTEEDKDSITSRLRNTVSDVVVRYTYVCMYRYQHEHAYDFTHSSCTHVDA